MNNNTRSPIINMIFLRILLVATLIGLVGCSSTTDRLPRQPETINRTSEAALHEFTLLTTAGQQHEAFLRLLEAYQLTDDESKPAIAGETHAWLLTLDDDTLNRMLTKHDPADSLGWAWLELHDGLRMPSDEAEGFINDWISDWEGHPATQWAIERAERIQSDILPEVKKATVLLPLSGKFSRYSAYVYRGLQASCTFNNCEEKEFQFHFVDTNIPDYYDRIPEDSDIILGPLLRSNIDKIRKDRPFENIPVVALNSGSQTNQEELSLGINASPEREAKEIARYLVSQGFHAPVIVAPQTTRGDRIVERFTSTWIDRSLRNAQCDPDELIAEESKSTPETLSMDTELQPDSEEQALSPENDIDNPQSNALELVGEENCEVEINPVIEARFDPSDKPSIIIGLSRAMGVHDSQYRGRLISAIVDRPTKKHARRRQDVDVIFFAVDTRAAKLLTPSLPYLYSSSIPAYGFSNIWVDSSKTNNETRDLSGLAVPLMPVDISETIDSDHELYAPTQFMLESRIDNPKAKRLYAIGYDAGVIAQQAKELESGSQIQSLLGKLMFDHDIKAIRNTLEWYRITPSGPEDIATSAPANQANSETIQKLLDRETN